MTEGLISSVGVAAPPFTKGPYTWDQDLTLNSDLTITGDLEVEGDFTFGDASTDTLTVNGVLNAEGLSTFGTFASPQTIAIAIEQLIMVSGEVTADLTAGVTRGIWVRTKVSDDQTGNSIIGIESQCRINGAASSANTLGAGQFTGMWAYWEQSGTTALNTGNLSSAVSCTVESAATLTIDSGAILAGIVVDSSVNASTANNGTFDGIYMKKAGGALDFVYGLEMTDCMSGAALKFADDQTICSDDNQAILVDISETANDGFIKVVVGSADKYIALYDLKSS